MIEYFIIKYGEQIKVNNLIFKTKQLLSTCFHLSLNNYLYVFKN